MLSLALTRLDKSLLLLLLLLLACVNIAAAIHTHSMDPTAIVYLLLLLLVFFIRRIFMALLIDRAQAKQAHTKTLTLTTLAQFVMAIFLHCLPFGYAVTLDVSI